MEARLAWDNASRAPCWLALPASMAADMLRLIIRSSSSSYRYLLGRLFALAVVVPALADELSTGRAQE
ncbi:hypothetical protein KP786_04915 [Streptococcus equi subsp. zooepidemicus]|uniref:hypothetical protein n=1 Tax=Streptococcus equi TaxID=1336 RepID=UPI0002F8DD6B|nr:hypothetical protein [Streptococcus equi]MCD3389858.1 hypothetical protein [Streptococcus equi subsp. zooepidemicus]MCD3398295.1 hypothetical protein [Streptococcus equi subsp. zooepidemicus]MCD3407231.1 hypothetical protein [Streptococcus equi subsp. zooepidemicus]MCD3450832.1 hypothetical protein [Streptococcus equi subsp. zooepidemicus]MCD3464648.1 hypothetical protein [Streptococcus equi subsp. zooepidemicus]